MIDRSRRAAEIFLESKRRIHVHTDRVFAILMIVQWLFAIGCALALSPQTWTGAARSLHPHVVAAVVIGGLLALPPVVLAIRRPGCASTRFTVAISQSLFSALLIHLTGGRIETHFHVFGSLAFLAFYRDVRVLLAATVIIAVDHFVRGVWWPESVFGLASPGRLRWLEHAAWVIFEDVFLFWSCRRGVAEMKVVASRQAELEALNADIGRLVEERTAELAEARDRALDAARVKSEFLANMSHEIRTPLNGVLGFVQLLRETKLDREQTEFVTTIQESGETLFAVINDVLDFSKIEAGHLELETIEFEPARVVEGVAKLIAPAAAAKGLEIVCDSSNLVGRKLLGDPTRLRQIVLNLTSNAVKFTPRGEVAIEASIADVPPGRGELIVRVRDTGIGISREKIAMLFQPFRQADGSTTRRFGGTGLGLAISKKLVELMGGTIEIESEVDRGSAFTVRVTLEVRRERPEGQHSLAGRTVLVVDDNQTNRRLLHETLTRFGATVLAAEDGGSALRILGEAAEEGQPIAGALLDYQMPGIDGVQLAREIRAMARFRDLPLVLLTSVTQGFADEALFTACLTKPLRVADVVDLVRTWRPGTQEATTPRVPAPHEPEPAAPQGATRMRVLVAEDNPVNQRLMLAMLRKRGCAVDIAHDGRTAVQSFCDARYDLILMDVQMPILDGFAATAEIRNLEKHSATRTPIIALTAHAISGYRERCIAAGMDDYLTKPIREDDLEAKLATVAPAIDAEERAAAPDPV